MIARSTCAVFLIAATSGCQIPQPPPTSVAAAVRSDCRTQADRQYAAQNRVDLTRRDERDFAYAGTYNTGIPSRGLSAEYQRDNMVQSCLRANADRANPVPGVGPTFSPADIGSGTSTLTP